MRALAHPTRLALLDHLHAVDHATATECAAVVGDSPSSCSYHLRALARWRFVEEAEGGAGRERPWRATATRIEFGSDGLEATVLRDALLGFWGGAIAGRIGTRRTMLVCDFARAPLFASIPLLHSAGLLPFPVLLALVAASGVFLAPYFSVQRAVVPELVGEEQHDVAYATAFFQAANRLTIFLGPPLAGVLIALIGTAQILYVDAATYLVSFTLVAIFVHPPEVPAPEDVHGVFDGVRFLLRDKLLRIWTPAFTVIDICWQLLFASLPVLVVTQYHANPRILGWLMGALGGGALAGAFASMRIVRLTEPLALGAIAFL